MVGRQDNVKRHVRTSVIWSSNGEPVEEGDIQYIKASKDKKAHTKYLRENGYSSSKMPSLELNIEGEKITKFYETKLQITMFNLKQVQ